MREGHKTSFPAKRPIKTNKNKMDDDTVGVGDEKVKINPEEYEQDEVAEKETLNETE